jgi:RNA polymerase sigma factor (sigma-70 family)
MPNAAPPRARSRPMLSPSARRRGHRAAVADDLVVAVVQAHADGVLRLARSYSLCSDDANDAYQRGLELLVRHSARVDPEKAGSWLRTVVKHEALAIRARRAADVDAVEVDLDAQPADVGRTVEDDVIAHDRVTRSLEVLGTLKPDEVRALWLRAEGFTYRQIAERCGWTFTKVNRLLAEGRATFLSRYATAEAGGACAAWSERLSAIVDGEAAEAERSAASGHLRSCGACRGALRELRQASPLLRAAVPVAPLVVAPRDGGGLLRVVEVAFAGAHDRAASAAVKAQAAIEALSAGKVAAVAASAAAVASGGVAAVERIADGPGHDAPAVHRVVPAASRASAAPAPPSAPTTTASVAPAEPASTPTTTAASSAAPSARAAARREHGAAERRREFDAGSREFDGPPAAPSSAPSPTDFAPAAEAAGAEEFTTRAPAEDAGRASTPAQHQGEFAP